MTDKELFEKIEKQFDLKKSNFVEKVYKTGNFNTTLLEIRQSRSPNIGSAVGGVAKGLGSAAIAGVKGIAGRKQRQAKDRLALAKAKQAEIEARAAQQKQMGYTTQQKPEIKFKVGDIVLINTKKGGKKQGILTQLLPDGKAQFQLRNGPKYMGSQKDILGKVEDLTFNS